MRIPTTEGLSRPGSTIPRRTYGGWLPVIHKHEERNVYTPYKSDCMVFNTSWVQTTFKSHRPFMPAVDPWDVTGESHSLCFTC